MQCNEKQFRPRFMAPALLGLLAFSTLHSALSTAQARGTAFTYQGQLNTGGAPATGSFDFEPVSILPGQ
jgi:hypothetical protein